MLKIWLRTDNSTEYASLKSVDRIIAEMDKINIRLSSLTKAVDTVDHNILLE